jgi:putative ABC transport system permease protein
MRRINYIEDFFQDTRFGLRMLRKSPGFTAVAVLTLALGAGATTAIFSVVDAVFLRPTLYYKPAELVEVGAKTPEGEEESVSPGDFADWRDETQACQGLAAYTPWEFHTLTGLGEPDEVWSSSVSPNLFDLLGIHAVLGRIFVSNEADALVLSYRYWRSHFSSDRAVIGEMLTLDGKPYVVVGVTPPDFEFPASDAQMWIPLAFTAADRNDHEHRTLNVVARLRAGVTLKKAQAEFETIAHRLSMQYPKTNAGWGVRLEQFKGRELRGYPWTAVFAVLGAVIFVQCIVCANVASTLLARGAARQGEMAIRAALGAGRWRLIRQMLIESLMLAGAASIAGLTVAWTGLHLIVSIIPRYTRIEIHDVERIAINLPVLGFAAALSLVTGIAVGLLPAMRVSGLNLEEALRERGRLSGMSARGLILQRALVVSEVALALVLLVGAGLMIQAFQHLAAAPVGFNPDHLLTVRVPLVKFKYQEGSQSVDFYKEVLQRIKAIPGVTSAGMATNLPFTGFSTKVDFTPPAHSPGEPGRTVFVTARSVTPGYFHAMGIPIKGGRDFTQADSEKDAPCVRIMNEAMARRYWPGENMVGKQLAGACPRGAALIVGVVGDSKQGSINSEAEPELYEPYAQHPFASFLATFVVHTTTNPLDFAAAVRSAVWEIDRDQPVIQVRTMENVILESVWRQRLSASILGTFAVIALFLSAVGIYGVLSYSVSRRTHEIGIRAALGATRSDVLQLIVGEGLVLTLTGVACGVLAALGLTRLLAGLLYGIRPRDPLTFVALSLLLVGVGLLAVYIPARRATNVDPMVALRYE